MKVNKKSLVLMFSLVLVAMCATFTASVLLNSANAQQARQSTGFLEQYYVGHELEISEKNIDFNGKPYETVSIVRTPDGRAIQTNAIRLEQLATTP